MPEIESPKRSLKETTARKPNSDPSPTANWRSILRHDVFISYQRSESAAYAAWLYQRLSEADLSCFLDEYEAVAGDPLTPAIERALRRARVLVVIITGQVYKSDWVGREVERFARSGRPIVPIRLGEPMNRTAAMDTPLRVIFERDILWIDEADGVGGEDAPTDRTISLVRGMFRFRRSKLLLRLQVAGVMALLAGIAMWALVERFNAIESQKTALSQELSVRAELTLPTEPSRSLELALQATRIQATAQSETALRRALRDAYLVAVIGGNNDLVRLAAFSHSGTKLATLHWPWRIEIRNASNLRSVVRIYDVSAAERPVVGMQFALNDTVLLTWDMMGLIKVWDVVTGRKLRTFGGHGFFSSIWMAPDRASIAGIADLQSTRLAVWDIASGQEIRTVAADGRSITAIAFSDDSKWLIIATIDRGATASSGYAQGKAMIHVIERDTDRQIASWLAGQRRIDQIAVSTSGDLIVSALGGVGPPAPTGTGPSMDPPTLSLRGHNDDALKIWSRDGTTYRQVLAADSYQDPRVHVSADQRFVLFADEGDAKLISTRPVGVYQTFIGRRGHVTSLTTASESSLAVTAGTDGSVRIWSVATGRSVCEFRGHVGTISAVSLSPDDRWALSVGSDGTARLWDMQCAQTSAPLRPALINRLPVNSNGRSLSVLGAGWMARLPTSSLLEWLTFDDTLHGRLTTPDAGEAILGISDSARRIAILSTLGQVRIVDVDRSNSLDIGAASLGVVFGAMSADGQHFVLGNTDGEARIFDAWSGFQRLLIKREAAPMPPAAPAMQTRGPSTGPMRSQSSFFSAGVFDPAGQRLALVSDTEVELRSVADGALIGRLKSAGEPVRKTLFSPDGDRLLTMAYGRVRGSSEAPQLWSTSDGRMVASLGGQGLVANAAFTPDGLRLLTSSTEGHLRLWDAKQAGLIADVHLPAESLGVRAVAVHDSGKFAAIGGESGRLIVVSLETFDLLLDLKLGTRGIRNLRFAPGSQLLAAVLDDDSAVHYRCDLCAPRARLIELAETRLKIYRSARTEAPVTTQDATATRPAH